jgi:hypothetical protein
MRTIYSHLVVVLIILASCAGMASAQSKPRSTWIAPPAIAKQLAAPTSLGFATIRLPKGIRLKREKSRDKGWDLWVGSGAGWGPLPTYAVISGKLTAEEAEMYSIQDITEFSMIMLNADIHGLQLTTPENGRINGVPFSRVRWSGVDKELRTPLHGFVYTSIRGRQFTQIMSQQIERTRERLRFTDASALTFRLK